MLKKNRQEKFKSGGAPLSPQSNSLSHGILNNVVNDPDPDASSHCKRHNKVEGIL